MDRRQRKTRDAIFNAFADLLGQQAYHRITVQQIIDAADVGRATFYAHFETKDDLLRELCEELFNHIIDTAMGHAPAHGHYTCGGPGDPVFLHLIRHLTENDRNILSLLSSRSNEIFLQYFKTNLQRLVRTRFADQLATAHPGLPLDFLVNHVSASFAETVSWWLRHGMKESPEQLSAYFEAVI